MTTHPDEAAFGFSETRYDEHGQPFASLTRRGLTKREYIAALAMQGLLSRDDWRVSDVAEVAVEAADALIAALNAGGQADA